MPEYELAFCAGPFDGVQEAYSRFNRFLNGSNCLLWQETTQTLAEIAHWENQNTECKDGIKRCSNTRGGKSDDAL